jgi:PAS domain-containing protein
MGSVDMGPAVEALGDVKRTEAASFTALEMTRMNDPDAPRQDDNPVVFTNNAFLDLTGYALDKILGRNCRLLQGAETDDEAISALRGAVAEREAIAIEILNYRRDGSVFWNAVFSPWEPAWRWGASTVQTASTT